MSDDADVGNETAELFLKVALKKVTGKKIDTSNQSGICWYCEDEIDNTRRFCDKYCADGWSLENE